MLVKTTATADPPAAVDGPAAHKNSDNDVSRAVTDVSSASAKEQHRCQWVGCDETFTEAQLLYQHLLEKHSDWPVGSVPLLCWWEPCEHFSKNPQHMRSHLLSHVSYYAYKCLYCDRPSKRKSDLRKHQKTCRAAKDNQQKKDGENAV
jgi:hypothetical protein